MSSEAVRVAVDLVPELGAIREELVIFERLLLKWQAKVNLVGRSTLSDVWVRHFADSGQLAGLCDTNLRWADLGSGAGFPGMVVALIQRSHSAGEMHLIESDSRKAAFLREVSRETDARAFIHNARCEDILHTIQPQVVTSRAMADMRSLFTHVQPVVEKGGTGLFMKGRDVASELTGASIPSSFDVDLIQSKIDPDSAIVRVRAI